MILLIQTFSNHNLIFLHQFLRRHNWNLLAANKGNKNSASCESYSLGEKSEKPDGNTWDLEENYKDNDMANFSKIRQTNMNLNFQNLGQQPATQKTKLPLRKTVQTIYESYDSTECKSTDQKDRYFGQVYM